MAYKGSLKAQASRLGNVCKMDSVILNHDIIEEAIAWRRHLHSRPELAFQEYETSDFVADKLQQAGIKVHRGLATTGVVGIIERDEGPIIGLRADMDALPLDEHNDFAHKSIRPGRMHACGHDGHTAMLLAAALHLNNDPDWRGTAVFIFQPAEENEGGGKKMVEEGLFDLFPVSAVFGMHNWPTLPVGKIALRPGPIMAGSDSFEIILNGNGTHAAMPNYGNDMILLGSRIVSELQTIISREIHPLESGVISVTQFHAGDAYNILPAQVILRGTCRYFEKDIQSIIEQRMEQIIAGICGIYNAQYEFRYSRRYPPTVNSIAETEFCKNVARKLLGQENVKTDLLPSMGAEDFSFMLQEKPGCYVWLGNDDKAGGCMLHNPNYDFNDEALPVGVRYWVSLVKAYSDPGYEIP